MKILVINTGSSSIKYKLFDMDVSCVMASGLVEKIGEGHSRLVHRLHQSGTDPITSTQREFVPDHETGLNLIVHSLTHHEEGAIRNVSEISAVGHRVVHGGEAFNDSVVINGKVMGRIEENIRLAPLHNPANLKGISVAQAMFSNVPHVAVFDTAFHQTIPKKAFLYALPYRFYETNSVRRYGFHGTSHAYVARQTAVFLKRSLDAVNLITVHLGNGASMTAIREGKSVDTTMGMTPLEGLVMGTRCGDLDPAVPLYLAGQLQLSVEQVEDILNRQSGLKGLCGTNDMREVVRLAESGDQAAASAIDVYTYRVKKYIGAFTAVLGTVHALIFTGGIGENAPHIRRRCCEGLGALGIELDMAKNERVDGGITQISREASQIPILVVPTDEELQIAHETLRIVTGGRTSV
jgi:acetate kinase